MCQNNYDLIEQVYKKERYKLIVVANNILDNWEQSKDCVQEAIMIVLELSEIFENVSNVSRLMMTITKRNAFQLLRKKCIADKHMDNVVHSLEQNQNKENNLFDYYPLVNNTLSTFLKLDNIHKVALTAYMYSIPLNSISKAYGYRENAMHSFLKIAFIKIKRSLTGGEISSLTDKKLQIDTMTTKMIGLIRMGMKYKDIARALNIPQNNVLVRVRNRLLKMEKHPDRYPPIEINTAWQLEIYNKYNTSREKSGNTKLTEVQISDIKKLLKQKKIFQKDIARKFGVSVSTINNINTGIIWGNVKTA